MDIKVDNIQVAPIKSTEEPTDSNKTAIAYPASDINLTIYPNPSNGVIKVRADVSGLLDVSILDFTGKLVLEETVSIQSELHLEHLPKGVYFVEVFSQNRIQKLKLILE